MQTWIKYHPTEPGVQLQLYVPSLLALTIIFSLGRFKAGVVYRSSSNE